MNSNKEYNTGAISISDICGTNDTKSATSENRNIINRAISAFDLKMAGKMILVQAITNILKYALNSAFSSPVPCCSRHIIARYLLKEAKFKFQIKDFGRPETNSNFGVELYALLAITPIVTKHNNAIIRDSKAEDDAARSELRIVGPTAKQELEQIRQFITRETTKDDKVQKRMKDIFTHQKKEVADAFTKAMKSFDVCSKYGLSATRGILLYGDPGTGKSEIIRAIYSSLNPKIKRHVWIRYISSSFIMERSCSLYDLFEQNSRVNKNDVTIFVVDDIDLCVGTREDFNNIATKDSVSGDKYKNTAEMMEILSNGIDGTNALFMFTTNYKDQLDPALLRSGRIDSIIEMKGIDKTLSTKMCKHFNLDDAQVARVLSNVTEYPVNQSYLQNLIVQEITRED